MSASVYQDTLLPLWKTFTEKVQSLIVPGASQNEHFTGLDIGTDFARLIKIDTKRSPFSVEVFASVPFPVGAVVKNEIKNKKEIISALRLLLYDAGVQYRQVAIAIPRALAIVKSIAVDSRLNEDEIHARAWSEAGRHFPDLVGNIYLDYYISGPFPQDAARLELVLVACRKSQIDPFLEVLTEAEFEVRAVDLNSYALERALRAMESAASGTTALLNLNFSLSSLIVIDGKTLLHAHDQDFDAHRMMLQIAEFKKNRGEMPEEVLVADEAWLALLRENLVSHLRHIMHFFYSTQPDKSIRKLILSGDCATVPGLLQFVGREMGVPVEKAMPFKNMDIASGIDSKMLEDRGAEFMLGFGLGLAQQV